MKTIFVAVLVLSLVTIGCKKDAQEATIVVPTEPTFEEIVVQNANIVQDAAEAFAQVNGMYPDDVDQVQPFLPNGELLLNPYLDVANNPHNGVAWTAGGIGYTPVHSPSGPPWGYNITGHGESGIIVHLFLDPNIP